MLPVRHRLAVEGPLDLPLTFTCGQAFRWRREGGAWCGIVGNAVLRATDGGDAIDVEVFGEDPGPEAIRRYVRLDQPPERFLAHAEELRDLPGFTDLLGLRLLRQDPWETLVSFLCSAASNVRKISAGVEGMAARWGEPIPGAARRAFPTASVLAGAHERELRALGIGFRAPFVLESARRVARPDWSWAPLRNGSVAEARDALRALPGVGPKIADCVLLFGLDRLDTYPVDRWIRRATAELAATPDARDEDLERWSRRLGPGRGYLQQILFHLRRTGGPLPALRPRVFPPDKERRPTPPAGRRRSA
jgi:N-glycosylase/DNA lyase